MTFTTTAKQTLTTITNSPISKTQQSTTATISKRYKTSRTSENHPSLTLADGRVSTLAHRFCNWGETLKRDLRLRFIKTQENVWYLRLVKTSVDSLGIFYNQSRDQKREKVIKKIKQKTTKKKKDINNRSNQPNSDALTWPLMMENRNGPSLP